MTPNEAEIHRLRADARALRQEVRVARYRADADETHADHLDAEADAMARALSKEGGAE